MHDVRGAGSRPTVLVLADAGPEVGVGHVIRCQALAEELLARGLGARQVGRMEVGWVADAYRGAGIAMVGPASVVDAARGQDVRAIVLDTYTLPAPTSEAVAALGKPTLAIVDGTTRGLLADLYLEQNPGSNAASLGVSVDRAMCGPAFALIRDQVRRIRTRAWHPGEAAGRSPRVAVLFGGTDPEHGAHVVGRAIARTEMELSVTLVAATSDHARELAGIAWGPRQRSVVVPANPGVLTDLAQADLVVSAGGSSVYELMCLGRPVALCPVADNQQVTYEHLVGSGLAVGLGSVEQLRRDPAEGTRVLQDLLGDPEQMAGIASAGFATVDGRGRQRVADRLLELIGATPA